VPPTVVSEKLEGISDAPVAVKLKTPLPPTVFLMIVMLPATQSLLALPVPPEAVLAAVPVVRVMVSPFTGIPDVAETTVVPTAVDVIVTVQVAVAAPPV